MPTEESSIGELWDSQSRADQDSKLRLVAECLASLVAIAKATHGDDGRVKMVAPKVESLQVCVSGTRMVISGLNDELPGGGAHSLAAQVCRFSNVADGWDKPSFKARASWPLAPARVRSA